MIRDVCMRSIRPTKKQFLGVGSSLMDCGALYLSPLIIDMEQQNIGGCDDVKLKMT